jgi:hypothetical protein
MCHIYAQVSNTLSWKVSADRPTDRAGPHGQMPYRLDSRRKRSVLCIGIGTGGAAVQGTTDDGSPRRLRQKRVNCERKGQTDGHRQRSVGLLLVRSCAAISMHGVRSMHGRAPPSIAEDRGRAPAVRRHGVRPSGPPAARAVRRGDAWGHDCVPHAGEEGVPVGCGCASPRRAGRGEYMKVRAHAVLARPEKKATSSGPRFSGPARRGPARATAAGLRCTAGTGGRADVAMLRRSLPPGAWRVRRTRTGPMSRLLGCRAWLAFFTRRRQQV